MKSLALMLFVMLASAAGSAGAEGKIAFASHRDGKYDIYVMNADGTDETRLTDSKKYGSFLAGTVYAF